MQICSVCRILHQFMMISAIVFFFFLFLLFFFLQYMYLPRSDG